MMMIEITNKLYNTG